MIDVIHPGERIIIKPVYDPERIVTDAIYLFRLENLVQLKRLQGLPGSRLRVKSENDSYDDYTIDLHEGHDFEILGQAFAKFERLG